MSDDQTTLSEFGADDGAGDTATSGDDGPTPASNAADIERLADLVGRLTDPIGELEQHAPTDSIDTEPPTNPRMFQ